MWWGSNLGFYRTDWLTDYCTLTIMVALWVDRFGLSETSGIRERGWDLQPLPPPTAWWRRCTGKCSLYSLLLHSSAFSSLISLSPFSLVIQIKATTIKKLTLNNTFWLAWKWILPTCYSKLYCLPAEITQHHFAEVYASRSRLSRCIRCCWLLVWSHAVLSRLFARMISLKHVTLLQTQQQRAEW